MSEKIRTMGDAVDAWIDERILSDPVLARQYLDAINDAHRETVDGLRRKVEAAEGVLDLWWAYADAVENVASGAELLMKQKAATNAHEAYRANGTEYDDER